MALRPVDWLLAAYNAVLAVVWAVLLPRAGYAGVIFVAHAAALALPSLLDRAGTRLTAPGRALREIYPLLWLLAFWSELGLVRELLDATGNDARIAALDLAIFGVHVNAVWMPRMPFPWLSEAMHLMYFAYYPLIFLPPILVGAAGRLDALRDITFGLLVTYLACYLIYVAFPVDGPWHTLPRFTGALSDGLFYRLVHGALHAGDSLGTAFPSSHVAGAVTIAYLGWRWFRPMVAAALTTEAVGVIFATVYTQNHYAIDAAAGLVWALVLQGVVAPALWRILTRAPWRPRAALEPVFPPRRLTPRTTGGVA